MCSNASGEQAALRGLMLDACARRTDDGELRRYEQPVGQHEQQDDEKHDGDRRSLFGLRRRWPRHGPASKVSTARSATRSTSSSYSPTVTRSPGTGRRPSAAVTRPPMVDASAYPTRCSAARRRRQPPCRRGCERARREAFLPDGSPALNSSPTLPSSSDSTSSSVSRPAGSAEFVHDERLMRPPFAQLTQNAIDRDAFVHAGDRAEEAAQAQHGCSPVTRQRTRSFVCSMPITLSIDPR